MKTVVCRGRITLPPFSQPSISQIRLRGIDAALRSNDGDGPLSPAPESEPHEELMYGPESENLCGEDGAYFEKTFTVFKVVLTIDSGMPGDDCDNWICVNDNVNVGAKATITVNMEPDVPARISLVLNGPVRFDDGAPTSLANGESTTIVGVWPGDDLDPQDYQFTVSPYWDAFFPCGESVEGSVFRIQEQFDFTYAYTYAVRDYEMDHDTAEEVVDDDGYYANGMPRGVTECHRAFHESFMLVPPVTIVFPPLAYSGVRGVYADDTHGIGGTAIGKTDYRNHTLTNDDEQEYERFTSDWAGDIIFTGSVGTTTYPDLSCNVSCKIKGDLRWNVNLQCTASSSRSVPPGYDIGVQYGIFQASAPLTPGGIAQAAAQAQFTVAGLNSDLYRLIAFATWSGTDDKDKSPPPRDWYTHLAFQALDVGALGGPGIPIVCRMTAASIRDSEKEQAEATATAGNPFFFEPEFILY